MKQPVDYFHSSIKEVIKTVTSFYALHELLIIAVTNTAPDWEAGSELARRAYLAILNTRTLYIPIPKREDKILRARLFRDLWDSTDLPHAIAAHTVGCTTIVAYDSHFQAIDHIISYRTPQEVIKQLGY